VPLPEHRTLRVVASEIRLREHLARHQGDFCAACDLLGLRWTASADRTIYVSRKDDVALLDLFVGRKR
jgi:hypothetical protein